MAVNPEVQVSIDHLTVTGIGGGHLEARDVVITASGANAYEAAAAVHTQLAVLLGLPEQDDELADDPDR